LPTGASLATSEITHLPPSRHSGALLEDMILRTVAVRLVLGTLWIVGTAALFLVLDLYT